MRAANARSARSETAMEISQNGLEDGGRMFFQEAVIPTPKRKERCAQQGGRSGTAGEESKGKQVVGESKT